MAFPDPRFFRSTGVLTADQAAEIGGAKIVQGATARIVTVAEAQAGGSGALIFAEKLKKQPAAAAAIIVPEGSSDQLDDWQGAVLEARAPKLAFARIAAHLFESLAETNLLGDTQLELDPSASVHPSAVIAPTAKIGAGTVIGPQSYIGPGVTLGSNCAISAHVSITHAELGDDCRVLAGAKIGEAGFGYTGSDAGPYPVPQLGAVRIGKFVDIGALSTIDRGTLGDTIIGDLTKIDNLCQVAHNCEIGRGVLIASQTGISGSCKIGDKVMIGGQVGMADHLTIGDGTVIAAKSGLMRDVEPGSKIGGSPAKPMRQWMREIAALGKLAKGS